MRRNNPRQHSGIATMRIGGQSVDKISAKIMYRCAECLGGLKYHNNGLACAAFAAHQGFIHKKEAARIAELQAANIKELEQFYTIKDGKVVLKDGD